MTKLLLSVLGFLLSLHTVSAQQENEWAFGTAAGIDFNGGAPVFKTTGLVADEACASVCGASGRLLFYTEGTFVWDSLGNLMPNGSELTNTPASPGPFTMTYSTAQGALIIPMPDSANKYYIFSLTDAETGYLCYSVVDMSLNNGLGDIVPGRKGILIDSSLSERMTAVVGDQCNIWLLTCSNTPAFKAFEITAAGISTTPVISAVGIGGSLGFEAMGCMAISPDRTKLAATSFFPLTDVLGAALYDFDAGTGIVSNPVSLVLDTAADIALSYSVCFSPDNSKLYINFLSSLTVDQFDLSSGDNTVIPGTRTYIGKTGFSQMKMGPDGKLYFFNDMPGAQPDVIAPNQALGCIQSPNLAGAACQYVAAALTLPVQTAEFSGWPYGTGLPGIVVPALVSLSPVITVNGFELSTTESYTTYQWFLNGTLIPGAVNSTYAVTENGDYTVLVSGENTSCSATSAVYKVTNVTGIDGVHPAAGQINIYPNPVRDVVYIHSPVSITTTLCSIEGKILLQMDHAGSISLQGLAEGTYWLRIADKNGVLVKVEKIVKLK